MLVESIARKKHKWIACTADEIFARKLCMGIISLYFLLGCVYFYSISNEVLFSISLILTAITGYKMIRLRKESNHLLLTTITYIAIIAGVFTLSNLIPSSHQYFSLVYVSIIFSIFLSIDPLKCAKLTISLSTLSIIAYSLQFFYNPFEGIVQFSIDQDYINNCNIGMGAFYSLFTLFVHYKRAAKKLNNGFVAKENVEAYKVILQQAKEGNKSFSNSFDDYFPDFTRKIAEIEPELSELDLETCKYIKLQFSSKEIAQLTDSTVKAVESRKYRVRKKLNKVNDTEFTLFLTHL